MDLCAAAVSGDLARLQEIKRLGLLKPNAPSPQKLVSFAALPHYALHYASVNGHNEVVQFLVDNGASIEQGDGDGDRALAWAAYKGQQSTVSLLLHLGANASARNKDGRTALDWASDPATAQSLRAGAEAAAAAQRPGPASSARPSRPFPGG